MGARGHLGAAAVLAVLVAIPTRSAAETQVEPIARLNLEGGYDSNALYLGEGGDRTGRISPEAGLRVRDHLWKLDAIYGGDWVVYAARAPGGFWSHRALLELDATPTERLRFAGGLHGSYAFDPVGLAQMGIFRTGQESAWTLSGRGRADWRATRRIHAAATLHERTVVFSGRTGGAMHQPGAEALWRATPRLSFGGAYAMGVFQGFETTGDTIAYSQALRARARYLLRRELEADVFAGPAFWAGPDGAALVPEAGAELRLSNREWDVRATIQHALGIGSTARPGLVDSAEVGAVRRFNRMYDVRSDLGIWRSGSAPSGRDATVGYAVTAEAGMRVGETLRVALATTHFSRLDDRSPANRRTTVGVRLGWALPLR
jgi:hypothetical protein